MAGAWDVREARSTFGPSCSSDGLRKIPCSTTIDPHPLGDERSDPTFRFLRRGAEKTPRPRAWCAYFEHAPFPDGRLPGGLAVDLIHSLLACRIPCGQGKMQGISAIQPFFAIFRIENIR